MTKRYFPIQTETACQLKWTWSSIYLYDGTTNSCHRVAKSPLTVDSFSQFHNTPKKLADRQLMLEGQWPTGGCDYCEKIERAGGSSDRLMHLAIPDLTPPELDLDPVATEVTPRIVEVYFDNTCNLSCIYCHNGLSSRIHYENDKFGAFESNGVAIANTYQRHPAQEQLTEQLWTWLDSNYATVRRFHLLGGEPFYQKQFDTCLDFMYNHSNRELEFNIVSNLMVSHNKMREYIGRIKELVAARKIKRFEVTASIDCWGNEQEYIRSGLDLTEWRKNFEYLVDEKWITLNINQVVTALALPTMPALIEYVNQHRQTRDIGHHLITANTPTYMNPDIFEPGFLAEYFDRVLAVMPETTWQQQEAKKYMAGAKLQIETAEANYTEQSKLKTYLTELDRRRNTNWRETFPWITGVLDNVV